MIGVAYRQAKLEDAADIHALLLKLAPEIPLLVDTLEREEALYALIRNCARSGQSWLALDEAQGIVGFVLVEPNQLGRHYGEHEVLDLRYGGVIATHRHRGIFGALVRKCFDRMVPLSATVSGANRAQMARRLLQLGFQRVPSGAGEERFRWEPGASG